MEWIDEQLRARGWPRKRLADAIPGMNESKLSLVMSGQRKLSAAEADAIRRYFGYRLPDDPPRSLQDEVQDMLARLGDGQIRAVALYLEALTGAAETPRQAS